MQPSQEVYGFLWGKQSELWEIEQKIYSPTQTLFEHVTRSKHIHEEDYSGNIKIWEKQI